MQNRDNPRGLKGAQLGQLHALRRLFRPVIDEWLVRWENWTVDAITNGDDFELGLALGTLQGAAVAWQEIITPPQADRMGAMARAVAEERTRRVGA